MSATQLDLLGTWTPDPEKDAILALIAGDVVHQRDREAIVDAIRASVDYTGRTSGNTWRPLIPTWVYPKVIGATVHALVAAGVLVQDGWLISNDVRGRNAGRPCRQYIWRTP
ncbi:MAG: hypothetical protein Q7V58_09590 [Actinomycetota bacterium]|nr:hypothetical protein [Actinomycetota bacterium]